MKTNIKKNNKSSKPKAKFSRVDKTRSILKKKKKSVKKKVKIDDLSGCGYEVCFDKDWFSTAPKCGHGPMLLFEKFSRGRRVKTFYACAASRNRKGCHAYVVKGDHEKKKTFYDIEPRVDYMLYDEIAALPPQERIFCTTCQKFVTVKERSNHGDHELMENLHDNDLLQPSSSFITALMDSKFNSQFFITKKATTFLHETLANQGITHVVSIGMPRVHEHVQCLQQDNEMKMKSILLDIEKRYMMFWPKEKFVQFNMFNHYFFNEEGEETFKSFLQSCRSSGGKCAVVLDPPFGGMVDCIAETIKWLHEVYDSIGGGEKKDQLKIFWLFPYFMKKRIESRLPDMNMLDYQVTYDNKRTAAQLSKVESPVRIFTNLANEDVPLRSNHYRFCALCRRYVAQDNKHCNICNTCPSLTGKTYRHCRLCETCVKPGWKHCKVCNRCNIPDHKCVPSPTSALCHLCKKPGHKRMDCPRRVEEKEGVIRCDVCDSTEHKAKSCPNRGKLDEEMQCYYCNETGHKTKNCPMRNILR